MSRTTRSGARDVGSISHRIASTPSEKPKTLNPCRLRHVSMILRTVVESSITITSLLIQVSSLLIPLLSKLYPTFCQHTRASNRQPMPSDRQHPKGLEINLC